MVNKFNSANPNDVLDSVLPLIALSNQYRGPTSGLRRDRGTSPSLYNSNSEPWGGVYDQTMYRSPAPTRIAAEPSGGAKKLPPFTPGGGILSAYTVDPNKVNKDGKSAVSAIVDAIIPPRQTDEFGFYVDAPPVADKKVLPPNPVLTEDDPWKGLRAGKIFTPTEGLRTASTAPKTSLESPAGLMGILSAFTGGGNSRAAMEDRILARNDTATGKRPITYSKPPANRGTTFDVMGNNNAFMPLSHQMSSRWQTGY